VSLFRSLVRTIHLAGYFVVYGTELLVKRPSTREARADWLHRFAASTLHGLGVQLEVDGDFPSFGAVISNHLSYLDIIVFAALHPCIFVSKAEVASYPVLGWMTTMAGTVYVARGQGGSAMKAREGMQAALDAGLPVVFFPEGTTSDGSGLLKFHSGLLAQVRADGAQVTAGHICYSIGPENGQDVKVSEQICYWGDMTLLPHIIRFLGLQDVRAKVRFASEPIEFSGDATHRKKAAKEAWVAVAELAEVATGIEEVHRF
jgi:1-acyl-sn-glycerol-3-phosphate acyltransferase